LDENKSFSAPKFTLLSLFPFAGIVSDAGLVRLVTILVPPPQPSQNGANSDTTFSGKGGGKGGKGGNGKGKGGATTNNSSNDTGSENNTKKVALVATGAATAVAKALVLVKEQLSYFRNELKGQVCACAGTFFFPKKIHHFFFFICELPASFICHLNSISQHFPNLMPFSP
jgi:hypothetical protein